MREHCSGVLGAICNTIFQKLGSLPSCCMCCMQQTNQPHITLWFLQRWWDVGLILPSLIYLLGCKLPFSSPLFPVATTFRVIITWFYCWDLLRPEKVGPWSPHCLRSPGQRAGFIGSSGSDSWLPLRMTWGSAPTLEKLNQNRWIWDPDIGIFQKLPKWFCYIIKLRSIGKQ